MNPEIKQKWIAALESGKYVRAKGMLLIEDPERGGKKHCCLGVLCDLHLQETENGKWEADYYRCSNEGDSSSGVLPKTVQEWADIDSTGEFILDKEDAESLSSIKNSIGLAFKEGHTTALTSINDCSVVEDYSTVIPFIKKHF